MKKIYCTALAIIFVITGYSQKINLIEGSLEPLRGQKAVKTEFTYDNMGVGKFPDEKDYIAKKKLELNAKEPGRGDSWENAWFTDRKDRFEPEFRELFAKYSGMSTVADDAIYTLIFKTTKTEPGWSAGMMIRSPAFIDGEIWIVESQNHSNTIAKISIQKSPGQDAVGFDFETGMRIQEAYAKAGKELGKFIVKKLK